MRNNSDMSTDIRAAVIERVKALDGNGSLDSMALANELGVEHGKLVDGSLKTLAAADRIVMEMVSQPRWNVSNEGKSYAEQGSPEYRVYQAVSAAAPNAIAVSSLDESLGPASNRGRQQALKRKWISFGSNKSEITLGPSASSDDIVDQVSNALKVLLQNSGAPGDLSADILKQLKQRKLAASKPLKTYLLTAGARVDDERVEATELTKDMIVSGEWKNVAFKKYNFDANGKPPDGGCLHTLLKVREQFRLIFLEMGFEEMPTNNYVESSFWNFDALFQPQQHPARDEHDTFFISDPARAGVMDENYMKRVRETHERGGFGSRGYRYDWSEDEARKNILRTHTTAVSSRMLYLLAQEKEFKPRKYFSIDRVFRNETLDATHLAEFHQIEGLVADRNLSLGHLKGIIHEFFKKMGMEKLRFKPTHNPYTTPSLEIHSYHEGLGKWVEVGNSGVFRPEMIRPMGIPEDVTVIAWGLSLERPTMIKYGISNIRDLFGHKVDLAAIQSNPICRLTF